MVKSFPKKNKKKLSKKCVPTLIKKKPLQLGLPKSNRFVSMVLGQNPEIFNKIVQYLKISERKNQSVSKKLKVWGPVAAGSFVRATCPYCQY